MVSLAARLNDFFLRRPPSPQPSVSLFQRRRCYFVDPQVQGALLRQAVWYWLWMTATLSFVVLVYRVIPVWVSDAGWQSGSLWHHVAPYLVASAVLLPIIVFHAICFSNRFVGPMVRVRATLKQLAQGEVPDRLVLRKTDFWSDLADDINDIAVRPAAASTTAAPSWSETVLQGAGTGELEPGVDLESAH